MTLVQTKNLVPGSFVTFWEEYGIYIGLAQVQDVSSSISIMDDDLGAYVRIYFRENGKTLFSNLVFKGGVHFSLETPEDERKFLPEYIEFLKILINGEIKILPRLNHPGFFYDDNLRVVVHDKIDE